MGTRLIHKGQRGFSLIELVIVIGLTGIITTAITLTIMQVFNMDSHTRNDMIAVSQVRQAGKLVSEDVLEADPKSVVTGGSPGVLLTLNWTEIGGAPNTYKVIYKLVGVSGGLQILWREHYINSALNSTTKVAEYIDPYQTSCAWNTTNKLLTFRVTATVGGQSETRVYQVKPRPGS